MILDQHNPNIQLSLLSINFYKLFYCSLRIPFIKIAVKKQRQLQIMNYTLNNRQAFTSAKNQILKQKLECATICMLETEKRVAAAKDRNRQLKEIINQLERNKQNNQQNSVEVFLKKCKEQEKNKLTKIQQLKKLINQYKYLCHESIKYKSMQAQSKNHYQTQPTPNPNISLKINKNSQICYQSIRQNSLMSALDCSQNENANSISISRNKSYKKIKTKIFCENCQIQFKPNEYYRHAQECQKEDNDSQAQISTARNKEQYFKQNGYKTVRN